MADVAVQAVDGSVKRHDLKSLLSGEERDFLVRNNGDQVKLTDLEGKVVGLYLSASSCRPSQQFTRKLVQTYTELSSKNAGFEVVFVSTEEDDESFSKYFSLMPWLAIPFSDCTTRTKLDSLFNVQGIPHLMFFNKNGEVVNDEGIRSVTEYGWEAYPFSPDKLKELEEKEKARMEAQTLESLLVSGELDYVIRNGGVKVPVSDLVGKNILLYFSAHWCPPCRAFLPKLIETYTEIKSKDPAAFELVFLSSDRDQKSYDDYFASMPWLAVPFGDERKKAVNQIFKIRGIPSLVAIGPHGQTVTDKGRELVTAYGADAYPFTEERVNGLETAAEEEAKGWPESLKHPLHADHALVKTKRSLYGCDGCKEVGSGWSFHCAECDFKLHPKCALNKEGYVCDGDVCYKT